MAPKSIARLKGKLRQSMRRWRGMKMQQVIWELKQMNRRIRNRTYGGVEAGLDRLSLTIRFSGNEKGATVAQAIRDRAT